MRKLLALVALQMCLVGTSHAQNLDLLRTGGDTTASDAGIWDPNPWWVTDPYEIGDIFADVTNTLQYDDGIGAGTGITDGVATCNVATSSATPAASVGAADSSNTSCFCRESWWGAGVGNIHEMWGVSSSALATLEVQPDPTAPGVVSGVLEATLSIVGTVTRNGQNAEYLLGGAAECGRFRIQYEDTGTTGNGGSGVTIYDAEWGAIYSINGGIGANYLMRTQDVVGVGSTFNLSAAGLAMSGCRVVGIGAAGSIASVSAVGSCTVTGIDPNSPNPPPRKSVHIKVDDDDEIYVPIGEDG